MKLTTLSEIRRKELRRAALEVVKAEGMIGTTLEKVAARAGASKGIVLHYFTSKRELFEHALREANSILQADVAARLGQAKSPKERLEAIIATNFSARHFEPAVCQAWLSLCAETPRDPRLARIQHVIHRRMESNLRSALKALVREDDVADISFGISVLIDGLWLRMGVDPMSVSRQAAIDQVKDLILSRTGIELTFSQD